jgi:hypothetical protein
MGIAELARQADLQPSGVARVCTRLEDLGVIEAVGRGVRHRQYRRASRFPLAVPLMDLFRVESQRALGVIQELRAAVQGATPGAKAAWIDGPAALGTDRPEDPIVVSVLVEPDGVDAARMELWKRLLPVQSHHDVAIELSVVTLADLETASPARLDGLKEVRPLAGPAPLDLLSIPQRPRGKPRGARKGHEHLDLRSRDIARVIADRIRRDPSIVEDARRYIERRLPSASPGERLELEEWQGILSTMSVPRLQRFLVQDDARATRLRQSSPFLTAISQEERRALLEAAARRR